MMSTRFSANPILHPLRMMILSYLAGLVSCVALAHFHAATGTQAAQGQPDSKTCAPTSPGIGSLNDNSSDEAVTSGRPSHVDTSRHDARHLHRVHSGRADSQLAVHRSRQTLVDLGVRLQI